MITDMQWIFVLDLILPEIAKDALYSRLGILHQYNGFKFPRTMREPR